MTDNHIDLLCVGETLVDFISTERTASLTDANQFTRYLGGSPANIAVTLARLGGRAAVASRVGAGAFGQFLRRELEARHVSTEFLRHDPDYRTTVVFVTRSQGTPDFEVFYGADGELRPEDVPTAAIERAKIIHTSTFALSRNPCRSTISGVLRQAASLGKVVSLDPNYNPQIWPDLAAARSVLTDLYAFVTITKPSLDDAARLFGPGSTPEEYVRQFHGLGPRTVVLTMGKHGTLLSHDDRVTHIPAQLVDVVDATGAGDAFWGGFLTAWLDRLAPEQCVRVANAVVAQKLQHIGHETAPIDKQQIYKQIDVSGGQGLGARG